MFRLFSAYKEPVRTSKLTSLKPFPQLLHTNTLIPKQKSFLFGTDGRLAHVENVWVTIGHD